MSRFHDNVSPTNGKFSEEIEKKGIKKRDAIYRVSFLWRFRLKIIRC